ncbi:MAG TPA: hypothetical protein VN238_00825 [Solirubrobacteraceae bacterium]|nr:hypothetical protein [Solirubrobacteraceae bacterium]
MPHLAGGLLGGLAVGVLAAGVAALAGLLLPRDALLAGAALAVAVYSCGELISRQPWRWSAQRQVQRDFQRTHYHRTTAFLWGADLGFGWSTRQPTSALLVVLLAAVAGGPDLALVAGVVFGVARAATLMLAAGTADRERVEARFDWLLRHPTVARYGTAVTGLFLTLALAVNIP